MRQYSFSMMIAATALGIGGGLVLAWWLAPAPKPGPAKVAGAPAAGSTGAARAGASAAAASPFGTGAPAPAVAEAAAPPASAAGGGQPLDDHALREQALRDPVQLRRLVDRLETETDPQAREQLKAVLGTIDKPEALAAFRRLAQSSDVARRRDAYDMLQHAPDSPEVRAILRQAMASEQTPEALVQAINALRPVAVEPAEAEAVLGQLRGLTQHADPSVRSQALSQLGQWDRQGEGRDRYAQGLADPVPQVRQAAVFAIAQSGVRGDNLKAGLLALVNNASESRELRGSALQALERFPLSRDEFAALAQARHRLGP